MVRKSYSTKSQVFYIDFIVGLLMFGVVVYFYFTYAPDNILTLESEDSMINQARSISISLNSKGIPNDWDKDNLVRIGIMDDSNEIDLEKLSRFYNLTYNQQYTSFNVPDDFYVYLSDNDGDVIEVGVGDKLLNGTGYINYTTAENIVKFSRIVSYNKTLADLTVLIWD